VEEIAGIAPMNPDNSALIQVREDLYGLQDALERYYSDNTAYPTTDQGIIALHKRAVGDHSPKVFPQEGYVQREPLDPWGRLYVLESEPFAGIKPSYKLFTLGADGKVGGRGPDADISTTQLKYLDLL
jgi:general secretion pathway protein G